MSDRGATRIEEYAFADFITRGELDRHLRRMRARYRRQRDALVEAIARELPDATVTGIAAGLHVTVRLPATYDDATHARAGRPATDPVQHDDATTASTSRTHQR